MSISKIVSEYELEYLKSLTMPANIEDHTLALDLNAEAVDKALKLCREEIQQPLWDLNLCFTQNESFEVLEQSVHQIQVYLEAYGILHAYKCGLKKAITAGQQLYFQSGEAPSILL